MPVTLEGSCRCGAVGFAVDSHTPHPFMRCYCAVCRKTAGGGGFAINLGAVNDSLRVRGRQHLGVWRVELAADDGTLHASTGQRHSCSRCASPLWLFDPTWPELVHPFASAIDTALPVPPHSVHMMLAFKPSWVVPQLGPHDRCFDGYPEQSLADWHKANGLWID